VFLWKCRSASTLLQLGFPVELLGGKRPLY
jgi:hypothetical protein